jgi:hypothetical protein
MQNITQFNLLLIEIRRSQCLNNTSALREPGPKNPIRILEHAILQTNHDELAALESRLN